MIRFTFGLSGNVSSTEEQYTQKKKSFEHYEAGRCLRRKSSLYFET